MTTLLVETSEEDSFLAVARHIGDLLNEGQERTALADTPGSLFTTNAESLLAEGRYPELLDELVGKFDTLFSKASDGDLECCLNVTIHLIPRLVPSSAPAAIQKVTKALSKKVDQHKEQRLQGLIQLFNVTNDSRIQYDLVLQTVAYAKSADLAGLLAPVVKGRVESWAKEWKLSTTEQQKIYLAVADLLRTNKKKKLAQKEAFKLTIRALATFDDASPQDVAQVKEIASTSVADFIRSPDAFQYDLLESPAVKQLASDAQHAPLYKLLTLLLDGNVKEVESFAKSNEALLQSVGVGLPEVQTKARLMALLALASASSQVSFDTIQERLDLSEAAEVEDWLVRAIGKKLIEGQMDQVRHVITITKSSFSTFGPQQWQLLHKQLAAWKENVLTVKEMVSHKEESGLRAMPNGVRAR